MSINKASKLQREGKASQLQKRHGKQNHNIIDRHYFPAWQISPLFTCFKNITRRFPEEHVQDFFILNLTQWRSYQGGKSATF